MSVLSNNKNLPTIEQLLTVNRHNLGLTISAMKHINWLVGLELQQQAKLEEAEANTTAELDAYLDQQLALQGELTKMTEPREVTMKRLYLQLEELEAEMEQLHREGAAEGEYHDDLENAINDLYNEIGE